MHIDGMLEEHREVRNALWEKAQATPGTYPILYVGTSATAYSADAVQDFADRGTLAATLRLTSPSVGATPAAAAAAVMPHAIPRGAMPPTAEEQRAVYLQLHLSSLEAALGEAASACMEAQPDRLLETLAEELATIATGGGGGGGKRGSAAGGGKGGSGGGAHVWAEEGARLEIEQAMVQALDAALEALPHEPLGWLAAFVRRKAEEAESVDHDNQQARASAMLYEVDAMLPEC